MIPTYAQAGDIQWNSPEIISESDGYQATYPHLLSDPKGIVHLFWVETRTTVHNADQPLGILFYSNWDEGFWSEPIDIYIDDNQIISNPKAIVDNNGIIHLVWLMGTAPTYSLYYSFVNKSQAYGAQHWSEPFLLASNLTGGQYSVDLARLV